MDSPRPEVRALLDGGVLWEGLGYGEDGGLGSTRVRYLLRIAAVEEEPTAGLASGAVTAVRATIVAGAAAVTAAAGSSTGGAATARVAGLEPPAWEGEEQRTRGRKTGPPRVFTM